MKNSNKGFAVPILIAIVAILVLGGYGAYKFDQYKQCNEGCGKPWGIFNNTASTTVTQIKDWKTYSNAKYGFEFKYPQEWLMEDYFAAEPTNYYANSVAFYRKENINGELRPYYFLNIKLVEISDLVKNLPKDYADKTFLGWLKSTEFQGTGPNNQINVNNINWFTRAVEGLDSGGNEYYYQKGEFVYILLFNDKIDKVQQNEILSTFKFTTPTTQTSNWQSGDHFAGVDKIIAYIKSKNVSIPVLLPTNLSFNLPSNTTEADLYVYVNVIHNSDKPDRYDVSFSLIKDCNGVNACSLGNLTGEVLWAGNLQGRPNDTSVKLDGGVAGWYSPRTCGGSCTPGVLWWVYKANARYSMDDHLGEYNTLVSLANSAIRNAQ